MGEKGLDFKHKEVININNAKRLRLCTRCNSRFENRCYNIYNCALKENRYITLVIDKAKKSCENSNNTVFEHFADVGKTIKMPKNAEKTIDDMKLTRYACYLIA